jgi:hypothetical protein
MDEGRIEIQVVTSGTSQLLLFKSRAAAEQFRSLMREKHGRVGPVFQPEGWQGHLGFYNYSRRLLPTLLQDSPCYAAVERGSASAKFGSKCPAAVEDRLRGSDVLARPAE